MAKEEISSLIKHVVTIFSFAMSTLALILSIAIGVQHQSAIQHINTELRNLGNRINQLSENIIAMQRKLILKSEALEINLGAQIGNLSEHYIDVSKDVGDGQKSLVQLQNKINVLRSTLDVTITNGIANLSQQQNATDINLLTALSQINGLKDDVMNITQRINTSVRIYDNCKEEQVSCEIKSERDRFWRVCSTPDMPLSIEVSLRLNGSGHYAPSYKLLIYTATCSNLS